jgi:hypothetical protein
MKVPAGTRASGLARFISQQVLTFEWSSGHRICLPAVTCATTRCGPLVGRTDQIDRERTAKRATVFGATYRDHATRVHEVKLDLDVGVDVGRAFSTAR